MLSYIPSQIPFNITVIGCGGTGSRLVPMLTQFIRSITAEFSPTGWLTSPTIRLVDDDVVEAKNLARQNFIEQDIGKPKAVVLAQRYNRAYGVNVLPFVKRINKGESLVEVHGDDITATDDVCRGFNTLFILCVDSAEARRDILKAIAYRTAGCEIERAPFIIDAGNENDFGQVKFFNMVGIHGSKTTPPGLDMYSVPGDVSCIPMPVAEYENMEDMPGQGSCADLDQTLAINAAMATTIMGVVQNYYYRKPFTFNEVSISLNGAGYTMHNTYNNFMRRVNTNETVSDMVAVNVSWDSKTVGIRKYWVDNRQKNEENARALFEAERKRKADLEQQRLAQLEREAAVEQSAAELPVEEFLAEAAPVKKLGKLPEMPPPVVEPMVGEPPQLVRIS